MAESSFELIRRGLFKMLAVESVGNSDIVTVASTCLSEVAYNQLSSTLTVTFVESGATYAYYNVAEEDFNSLVNQFGSVGETYNDIIKGSYSYTRLN